MADKLTTEDINGLLETSDRYIHDEAETFHRYLYDEIDWNDRLISIKGARGVGKSTMMRQRIKEIFGEHSERAVYVSLDDLWFSRYGLKPAIVYLYEHGFSHVFIDEVHRLGKNWSLEIKNITDEFRKLNVVYSGSSLLQLENSVGDLSRRQAPYELKGMSFREFLALEGKVKAPPLKLQDVLKNHRALASELSNQIEANGGRVLSLFEQYLKSGYYPFYRESHARFGARLESTINTVLNVDYPAIEDVSQDTIRKCKRMLMVLAASCPQTPNMSKLYSELDSERNQGLKMLNALERAGLLALVRSKGDSLKNLSKPEKIYCNNPNLMHALTSAPDRGTMRETFFYNQVVKNHAVEYTGVGDFVVDGEYTFEVGGKRKGFEQIADLPRSFVVNDDTEVGRGNKIPLWLFGFLY